MHTLGVVGGGNMAEAILRGALRAGVAKAAEIVVCEPRADRREQLARDLGVACSPDNLTGARCPNILLAVKPQVMPAVLAEIAPAVGATATVVSIAAGISTSAVDRLLGGLGRIVRVMPNTPMLVGEGMSALAAGPRATREPMDWAERLFAACGRTCVVREELMDAVTAVSGSGPAYFYYLVEAMIAAGLAEGLDEPTARALASQTCLGAGRMLVETSTRPEDLRAAVTSPGGTTQRAIETLDAAGVKASLVAAIRAAAARSRELNAP